jgi:lysozyme
MKMTDDGIKLIESFESLQLNAYKCPAGIWTIGYGHTAGVTQGMTCTQAQAVQFLMQDLGASENAVLKYVKSQINDNQFSALVSFTFNCGAGNLQSSTLLKKVNINPADATIRNEFMKWNKGGGKVLAGLTRRRQAEADLYFS